VDIQRDHRDAGSLLLLGREVRGGIRDDPHHGGKYRRLDGLLTGAQQPCFVMLVRTAGW
jgi:hypothetical protein